jgi:hypothetical protein
LIIKELPPMNVDHLDELFFVDGLIQPVPAVRFDLIDPMQLKVWWHTRATYCYPTLELVAWLKERIAGRSAIEIGAGKTCVCRALGIPLTDARLHERPDVKVWFQMMNQPLVVPPDDVEKLTDVEAIEKYKPEVVVGCWVTQLYRPPDMVDSNMYGVDEVGIVEKADYILIGNRRTHGRKHVFHLPFEEINVPWLRTRGFDAHLNRIWYFRRNPEAAQALAAELASPSS